MGWFGAAFREVQKEGSRRFRGGAVGDTTWAYFFVATFWLAWFEAEVGF